MNFLAHIALSDQEHDVIVGNLMEDYITGSPEHARNEWILPQFKVGVKLHRLIDTFTDSDPVISNCKKAIAPKHGKFSSVLIDIYFDHFLSKNWDMFYTVSLANTCENAYQAFEQNREHCPDKMKNWIDALLKYQWLEHYSHLEGIQKALNNVSTKTYLANQMHQGLDDLLVHYEFLEQSFKDFFPRIQSKCQEFLVSHV